MAVREEIGTIEYVGEKVAEVGAALVAALLLCFIGVIVSAFAPSVGVLGATIPLAVWWSRAGCEPLGGTVLG